MILRHTFTPHNNARLSHLCGPADCHLRTIEAALQVSIAHRHEQFKVDGPKARATQAMEMLQAVYEIAERPVSDETVQLMLAGDSELVDALVDGSQLTTRRADLRARTATQALTNVTCRYIELLADSGLAEACRLQPALLSAINIMAGQITHPAVAHAHQLPCVPPRLAL